jgi:hypothetical protein
MIRLCRRFAATRILEDSANLPDLGLSQSARHCAGQHNDRPASGEHDNSESNQLG